MKPHVQSPFHLKYPSQSNSCSGKVGIKIVICWPLLQSGKSIKLDLLLGNLPFCYPTGWGSQSRELTALETGIITLDVLHGDNFSEKPYLLHVLSNSPEDDSWGEEEESEEEENVYPQMMPVPYPMMVYPAPASVAWPMTKKKRRKKRKKDKKVNFQKKKIGEIF